MLALERTCRVSPEWDVRICRWPTYSESGVERHYLYREFIYTILYLYGLCLGEDMFREIFIWRRDKALWRWGVGFGWRYREVERLQKIEKKRFIIYVCCWTTERLKKKTNWGFHQARGRSKGERESARRYLHTCSYSCRFTHVPMCMQIAHTYIYIQTYIYIVIHIRKSSVLFTDTWRRVA